MSRVFAILTSDPNLARCEVHRVQEQVSFAPEAVPHALGVGVFADGHPLLRHSSAEQPFQLGQLKVPLAKAILVHAGRIPPSVSLEEGCQPFRLHGWMFASTGLASESWGRKEHLLTGLPSDLRQALRGGTEGERLFAHFLLKLRSTGQLDVPQDAPEAPTAALLHALQVLEGAATAAQDPVRPDANLVATNGAVLVAVRASDAPLFYKLMEGEAGCSVCGAFDDGLRPELSREHRVCKSVVLASQLRVRDGWVELPDGAALCVDAQLGVCLLRLPQRGP